MIKQFFVTAFISLFVSIQASAQEFIEDVNYYRLSKPLAVQTGDKIEVLELFWYRCPHCYRLEPYLNRWQKNKPEYVEYVRLPAVLTKSWEFDARVFYTFEALGLIESLHEAYFDVVLLSQYLTTYKQIHHTLHTKFHLLSYDNALKTYTLI